MKAPRRSFLKRAGKVLASMSLTPWEGNAAGMGLPAAGNSSEEPNPLASPDQLDLEDVAIRLFHSAPVRAAMERGRKLLNSDWRARRNSGRKRLGLYLDEMSFLSCLEAAVWNAGHPKLLWVLNLPHRWFGRDVPGSRCGVDNPDNVHRLMRIDPGAAYVITGRVPLMPAAQVSFNVSDELPGNGRLNNSLAMLTLENLVLDPDRSFRLTLDHEPANGRKNHLQLPQGSSVLLIRDTMSDWEVETPLYLDVKCISDLKFQMPDESSLAGQAAQIIDNTVPFWSRLMEDFFFSGPHNKLVFKVNPTIGKGNQFGLNGNFSLKPDQAYVITLVPMEARYAGVELCDLWGASVDYASHTGSLNNAQAVPNPDGTVTYVISLADPGVHNWLDPEGLEEGTFMFRFQGFTKHQLELSPETVIREEMVVKLSELDTALPAGIRRVTPGDRYLQIEARRKALSRRTTEFFSKEWRS